MGNELAAEAGKAIKDAVKSNVPDLAKKAAGGVWDFASGALGSIFGIVKNIGIVIGVGFGLKLLDEKFNGGKIFNAISGAIKEVAPPPKVIVDPKAVTTDKTAKDIATEMLAKKGATNCNVTLTDDQKHEYTCLAPPAAKDSAGGRAASK